MNTSTSLSTGQKGFTPIILLIGLLVVLLVGGIGYYLGHRVPQPAQSLTVTESPSSSTFGIVPYDNLFMSAQYPANWYVWSYGRGVSLAYFQVNSVPEDQQSALDKAIINFDIQTMNYTEGNTLAEEKQLLAKELGTGWQYTVTDGTVDGHKALVIDKTYNSNNQLSYDKTVWVIKDNVKYIFQITIQAETQDKLSNLKAQDVPVFDTVVQSVKLRDVDPAAIDKLGNHPNP